MKRWVCLLICYFLMLQANAAPVLSLLDSAKAYQSVNTSTALQFALKALKYATQAADRPAMAECNYIIGKASYLDGEKEVALRSYLDAVKLYAELRDTTGLIKVHTELCILYLNINKKKEALQEIELAIEYSARIKNYDLLGTAYNNKGLVFTDNQQPDSARTYFIKAYRAYGISGSTRGMAYSLDYLASASITTGHLDSARQYLQRSIILFRQCGDRTGEAIGINNMGELLLQEHKPAEAISWFKDAIEKARQINLAQLEDNAWQMLAQCYKEVGDYKNALDALTQHTALQKEIVNESMLKKVEELSARYEADKREQQNRLLREQNGRQQLSLSRTRIISLAIAVAAILLLSLVLLFFNRRKLKQEATFSNEMREAERLKANAIVEAEENERRRLARELHDGIGQTLAAVRRSIAGYDANGTQQLPQLVTMVDSAIVEARQLSHEMMPPWLRNKTLPEAITELAERISQSSPVAVQVELTDMTTLNLEKVQVLMLYRSVQEILANSVRHSGAATINIEMVNHSDELSLMIYDDGKGFDVPAVLNNATGIGLQNIISRIGYIGGSVEIDSHPGNGTTFNISLPLKHTT